MVGAAQYLDSEIKYVLEAVLNKTKSEKIQNHFRVTFGRSLNNNQIRYIKNKYGRAPQFNSPMVNNLPQTTQEESTSEDQDLPTPPEVTQTQQPSTPIEQDVQALDNQEETMSTNRAMASASTSAPRNSNANGNMSTSGAGRKRGSQDMNNGQTSDRPAPAKMPRLNSAAQAAPTPSAQQQLMTGPITIGNPEGQWPGLQNQYVVPNLMSGPQNMMPMPDSIPMSISASLPPSIPIPLPSTMAPLSIPMSASTSMPTPNASNFSFMPPSMSANFANQFMFEQMMGTPGQQQIQIQPQQLGGNQLPQSRQQINLTNANGLMMPVQQNVLAAPDHSAGDVGFSAAFGIHQSPNNSSANSGVAVQENLAAMYPSFENPDAPVGYRFVQPGNNGNQAGSQAAPAHQTVPAPVANNPTTAATTTVATPTNNGNGARAVNGSRITAQGPGVSGAIQQPNVNGQNAVQGHSRNASLNAAYQMYGANPSLLPLSNGHITQGINNVAGGHNLPAVNHIGHGQGHYNMAMMNHGQPTNGAYNMSGGARLANGGQHAGNRGLGANSQPPQGGRTGRHFRDAHSYIRHLEGVVSQLQQQNRALSAQLQAGGQTARGRQQRQQPQGRSGQRTAQNQNAQGPQRPQTRPASTASGTTRARRGRAPRAVGQAPAAPVQAPSQTGAAAELSSAVLGSLQYQFGDNFEGGRGNGNGTEAAEGQSSIQQQQTEVVVVEDEDTEVVLAREPEPARSLVGEQPVSVDLMAEQAVAQQDAGSSADEEPSAPSLAFVSSPDLDEEPSGSTPVNDQGPEAQDVQVQLAQAPETSFTDDDVAQILLLQEHMLLEKQLAQQQEDQSTEPAEVEFGSIQELSHAMLRNESREWGNAEVQALEQTEPESVPQPHPQAAAEVSEPGESAPGELPDFLDLELPSSVVPHFGLGDFDLGFLAEEPYNDGSVLFGADWSDM